jgi:hypothetical protein
MSPLAGFVLILGVVVDDMIYITCLYLYICEPSSYSLQVSEI